MRTGPVCPRCGEQSRRRRAAPNRAGLKWVNFCCGLVSWDSRRLEPGRGELLAAKNEAHAAFDPIWKEGHLTRSAAYERLAAELEVPEPKAHMAVMSFDLLRRVPAAALRIKQQLGAVPEPSSAWDIPVPSFRLGDPT